MVETKEHHDVEAGTGARLRIPLFRRKRSLVTALCLMIPFLLLLLVYGYQTEAGGIPLLRTPAPSSPATTEAIPAVEQVDMRAESLLLLLQALSDPNYSVGDDWHDVYINRTPLDTGIMGTINSAATNRFTQLLFKTGLPPSDTATGVKKDALQLYRLSRSEWMSAIRSAHGLTVFSKSYCPYSRRAKQHLTSLNAKFTLYEVDLRPDAAYLQPLLAQLTSHRTFPTILLQDRLLGGSDDLLSMSDDALHAALVGVKAL